MLRTQELVSCGWPVLFAQQGPPRLSRASSASGGRSACWGRRSPAAAAAARREPRAESPLRRPGQRRPQRPGWASCPGRGSGGPRWLAGTRLHSRARVQPPAGEEETAGGARAEQEEEPPPAPPLCSAPGIGRRGLGGAGVGRAPIGQQPAGRGVPGRGSCHKCRGRLGGGRDSGSSSKRPRRRRRRCSR
ncbi:5E5 antigen-like [Hemicordylus capensis]|uniref:5E5 antigen-like n=1 Tax=Hemicordylus capensis TaxID=884348 RepID=UPI002304670E|nr:5E5 antigen-like [Hemicordylus capensis]